MTESSPKPLKLYARLGTRFTALTVDIAVLLGLVVSLFVLRMMSPLLVEPSAFGWIVVAALALYEPILVATLGGTVGHRMLNLRVEVESDGSRPLFVRALLRLWLKWLMAPMSLLFMAATRTRQALHDLMTGSFVVARDSAPSRPDRFVAEPPNPFGSSDVSAGRRIGAIVAFGLGLTVVSFVVPGRFVSEACRQQNLCTSNDTFLYGLFGLIWMAGLVFVFFLGWEGYLPTARERTGGVPSK